MALRRRSGESIVVFFSSESSEVSKGTSSRGMSKPQARTRSTRVSTLGATTPCSQRAMTDRSRPVLSAISAWVRPARRRASLIRLELFIGWASLHRGLTEKHESDMLRASIMPSVDGSRLVDYYTDVVLPALAD